LRVPAGHYIYAIAMAATDAGEGVGCAVETALPVLAQRVWAESRSLAKFDEFVE
jgi:hypothetical protein